MSGGKSQSFTVGYWYYSGMHLVLCHSTVDAVKEIIVGERTAWSGNVTSTQRIFINNPNLFGGEEREGGIVGNVDFMFGDGAQAPNDYLVDRIGGGPSVGDPNAGNAINDIGRTGYTFPTSTTITPGVSGFIPAFRGVLSLVLRQVKVSAINPYIKPWRVRVKRLPKPFGPDAFMDVNGDANPAYIIAECLINAEWGMGYNAADLDVPSFTSAAQALLNEGFGMSLSWEQQQTIEDFLGTILKTIDASVYMDITTGKFKLKLARADYNPSTLLILDDTNIASVTKFARPSLGELVNQVTVSFVDRTTGIEQAVTLQDIASIAAQGGVSATSISYRGIPTQSLAQRVCMRELTTLSRGIASATIVANRIASQLNIGDVFKLNWAPLGIVGMVMRVAGINYGLLTDGRVQIDAIEDVFAMPTTTYMGQLPSGGIDPVQAPTAITNSLLLEAPYWLVAQMLNESASALADLPAGYGFLCILAQRAQSQSFGFDEWVNQGSFYTDVTACHYTPLGLLSSTVDDVNTTFTISFIDVTNFQPDTYALVDSELVQITGISGNTVTVVRGVLDTVPTTHASGATLWLAGGNTNIDQTTYLNGQTVQVKLQPSTSKGQLALTSISAQSFTFANRATRPYPPGNIKITGVYRPKQLMANVAGAGAFSWSHRNRLTQTAGFMPQTNSDVTPETGTTYTLTIKEKLTAAASYTVTETQSGITANNYAPVAALVGCFLRFEIFSVVSGLASMQTQVVEVERAGYGINYGQYYGGF